MRYFLSFIFLITIALISCQKEIDGSLAGTGGTGSGGTGGGNSTSGDLLVKSVQITPATNDTNTITFSWDANKRLLSYISHGSVNSTAVDISYLISRGSDGKINKLGVSFPQNSGLIDSIIYYPFYLPGGNHLSYVIDTEFTIIGQINDSSAYTYGSNGMVSSKETFTGVFGLISPASKESYTYDAGGNVTTITYYTVNSANGYDVTATDTYTFDMHKNFVSLGDESYIVLGAANVSKNNPVKKVTTDMTGNGTSYTSVFSQEQFNSNDRPTQSLLSVTPQPPGYDMKLLFYYQ